MSKKPSKPVIPRTIWALGFVSFFMDISSELIHGLLPVYLVTSLGASVSVIGIIEGVAEATGHIIKVFSGAISDFLGRRKIMLLLGYGLAAVSKPLFPMADSVFTVFIARFIDRIGKGIRGAPRDALIADVAPPALRGACFGLRQSMDTVGAFLGPLLAIGLLFVFHDITLVLWAAVIPASLAVLVIVFGVKEPETNATRPFHSPLKWSVLKQFSTSYWWVVLTGAFFTLARFSEAFLVLRAEQMGLSLVWIPAVMVVMSLVYALSAYPVGILSDRINKKHLLGVSLLLLILADMVLATAQSLPVLMSGVALWGLHMGFSQGTLSTLIAETTPPALKGTAFGLFNFVSGLLMLLASVLAGFLWDRYGAAMSFYAGAVFACLALILLLIEQRQRESLQQCDNF